MARNRRLLLQLLLSSYCINAQQQVRDDVVKIAQVEDFLVKGMMSQRKRLFDTTNTVSFIRDSTL